MSQSARELGCVGYTEHTIQNRARTWPCSVMRCMTGDRLQTYSESALGDSRQQLTADSVPAAPCGGLRGGRKIGEKLVELLIHAVLLR